MANEHQLKELFDATAFDNEGEKLGSVKEIFVDDNTGDPTFVEVSHGLFGMSSSLVPLRGASFDAGELKLAFVKDRIKDAPDLDSDRNLTSEQQEELYRHYGVADAPGIAGFHHDEPHDEAHDEAHDGPAGVGAAGADAEAGGKHAVVEEKAPSREADPSAAATEPAGQPDEVVRAEERLNVDKDRVASGEARLRKYVVEDTETVEVPVTREEVRLERTPISAEEAKNYTGTIGEEEASVTLHEERVNVNKETVPVEKVSLKKDQVEDTETIQETVRKEQFDTDGVDPNAPQK